MKKTLVTGATGFVGSAVCHRLAAAGHELRVLSRAASDQRNLADLDAEIVTGDLTEAASLKQAVAGCHAVFHVAADYRLWCKDPRQLYQVNVDGTRSLMQAALDARVERIVYTSSVATLGLKGDGTPGNETTPVSLADMIGDYKRSKFIAEQVVCTMVREQGLPAVIVNPSAPVGPRDVKPTPTGRMVLDAAAGKTPAYVDSGLNVVHVDDVADGHFKAFERGQEGQRYILGGHNLTLKEIFTTIAGISGQRPPRIRLPHQLLLPVAHVSELLAKVTGQEPRVTVDGLRMARKYMFFDTDKAQRELGYQARDREHAFVDAVNWFHSQGYLT